MADSDLKNIPGGEGMVVYILSPTGKTKNEPQGSGCNMCIAPSFLRGM